MKMKSLFAAVAAGIVMLGSAAALLADETATANPSGQAEAAAPSSNPDEAVATVNGKVITRSVVDGIIEQAKAGQQIQEDTPEVRRQVVDRLVELELLAQKAVAEGLDKDPGFVREMEMARNQQLYMALVKSEILGKVKVTPEEMREYYDKHKEEFKAEEQVTASHILVDAEDEAKAVKARLDKGEEFAAVAKDVSKCPSASRGGDLGPFGKGRMVPEFEKAAFALKVDEVSGPVKTQFGWHIIKVTARREAGTKPLDEVMDQINQALLQDKQKKAYDDMVADLKAGAKIDMNEAAFPAPAKSGDGDGAQESPAPADAE